MHEIFEMRAAVDHAVSHSIDVRMGCNGTRCATKQGVEKMPDGHARAL
jgi:hypothetical protein